MREFVSNDTEGFSCLLNLKSVIAMQHIHTQLFVYAVHTTELQSLNK